MFELADCLVVIYKTYNCTKSVTFNIHFKELTNPDSQRNLTRPQLRQDLASLLWSDSSAYTHDMVEVKESVRQGWGMWRGGCLI